MTKTQFKTPSPSFFTNCHSSLFPGDHDFFSPIHVEFNRIESTLNSGPIGDGAERACSAHHGGDEEERHEGDRHHHNCRHDHHRHHHHCCHVYQIELEMNALQRVERDGLYKWE